MATPPSYLVPYPQRGSVLADEELEAITEVLRSDVPLSGGVYREAFEQRFREMIGARHALSVTSGTVALSLAVALLGLRPGDELIVTPQTYKATIQPLLDYPVTVRFCDVDPLTLNADPASIEALVTERTKAILLVHYGGLPADMDRIMDIARRHGILVVEDCAHALGSRYRDRRPGALADIGCFSFHTSKNITTLGEGGMVTMHNAEHGDAWAVRLDRMRSNDSDADYVPAGLRIGDRQDAPPWMLHAGNSYTHDCVELRSSGTNATLPEPSAAVGIVQLNRLDRLVKRRRENAARITDVLRAFPFVEPVTESGDVVNAYHLYTFFLDPAVGVTRDTVVERLGQLGVQLQLRYFPLHLLPEWRARGHRFGECPAAEEVWFRRQVNVPCQPSLSDQQVNHLLEALHTVLTEVERTAG
ncbi:DegT/DnrJ/EryC1/StrS family aminotransferase [Micromonospora craniellae]|uniref:DegT/DnrJ/EryC1/StrS family aminotransferase n=1 Tax=Micromonospora craniellae TaxID=2294034 RepID=A0A372G4N7_9ACTN|nr:DegT/DnrJ/EryC1/StrS family aminotransferase [Micromonospora craniellae]QOC90659.1 DegT/DnrJ/EryC1/StrS family aminotransferase [Micromonospora craniellae]RFS47963.1 DegT/DnrJ/EryC1/StrS family aminotransferase [Micromonospora craniellae]